MRVGIAGISTINADTSKMWALLMNSVRGSNTKEIYEALLTEKERFLFSQQAQIKMAMINVQCLHWGMSKWRMENCFVHFNITEVVCWE
ncbi:hypothetical protein [Ferruginibacter sp.]|uniref:hypothetical protein n=1 Tax=Ferruginibacter sp. TaxID=1940288 RepID=UPI0019B6AA85|nr:hypothetical protein [Ferruginibacter sp.]MBC7626151.1 hypothetical protein [Ferruginibacter sp.]